MSDKNYRVVEVFYAPQGEGIRAGTANVFVRFSGCNMRCDLEPGPKSPGGFACDTEFESGRKVTLPELLGWIEESISIQLGATEKAVNPYWLILTGGEPGLQVDKEFCDYFHERGYKLAIETNGTVLLPHSANLQALGSEYYLHASNWSLDWITLSPKVAEHAVKQPWCHEVKYVRAYGQGIPKPSTKAENYLISPAFEGGRLDPRTLEWCVRLCLENPQWRLSVQQHHGWKVR